MGLILNGGGNDVGVPFLKSMFATQTTSQMFFVHGNESIAVSNIQTEGQPIIALALPENSREFTIGLSQQTTLQDALRYHFRDSIMDDYNLQQQHAQLNQLQNDFIDGETVNRTSFSIGDSNLVCFSFKIFDFNPANGQTRKSFTKFHCPDNIHLQGKQLRLSSLGINIGNSLDFSHYIARVRTPNGIFELNDSNAPIHLANFQSHSITDAPNKQIYFAIYEVVDDAVVPSYVTEALLMAKVAAYVGPGPPVFPIPIGAVEAEFPPLVFSF